MQSKYLPYEVLCRLALVRNKPSVSVVFLRSTGIKARQFWMFESVSLGLSEDVTNLPEATQVSVREKKKEKGKKKKSRRTIKEWKPNPEEPAKRKRGEGEEATTTTKSWFLPRSGWINADSGLYYWVCRHNAKYARNPIDRVRTSILVRPPCLRCEREKKKKKSKWAIPSYPISQLSSR